MGRKINNSSRRRRYSITPSLQSVHVALVTLIALQFLEVIVRVLFALPPLLNTCPQGGIDAWHRRAYPQTKKCAPSESSFPNRRAFNHLGCTYDLPSWSRDRAQSQRGEIHSFDMLQFLAVKNNCSEVIDPKKSQFFPGPNRLALLQISRKGAIPFRPTLMMGVLPSPGSRNFEDWKKPALTSREFGKKTNKRLCVAGPRIRNENQS